MSAFANAQAIQRIAPYVLEAKARGANINIVVGLDVKSTSAEALKRINVLGVISFLFTVRVVDILFTLKFIFLKLRMNAQKSLLARII